MPPRLDPVAEARKLISEFDIQRLPVPLDRIVRAKGIVVQYAPLDGDLSGMAFMKDGHPVIGVNSLHHPNRQRFTIAHELGHIVLHRPQIENAIHLDRGSLQRGALASMGIDSIEIDANRFAAELLMPKNLLGALLDGKTVDLEDDASITELAKKFRVSEAALRFRLDATWK